MEDIARFLYLIIIKPYVTAVGMCFDPLSTHFYIDRHLYYKKQPYQTPRLNLPNYILTCKIINHKSLCPFQYCMKCQPICSPRGPNGRKAKSRDPISAQERSPGLGLNKLAAGQKFLPQAEESWIISSGDQRRVPACRQKLFLTSLTFSTEIEPVADKTSHQQQTTSAPSELRETGIRIHCISETHCQRPGQRGQRANRGSETTERSRSGLRLMYSLWI